MIPHPEVDLKGRSHPQKCWLAIRPPNPPANHFTVCVTKPRAKKGKACSQFQQSHDSQICTWRDHETRVKAQICPKPLSNGISEVSAEHFHTLSLTRCPQQIKNAFSFPGATGLIFSSLSRRESANKITRLSHVLPIGYFFNVLDSKPVLLECKRIGGEMY